MAQKKQQKKRRPGKISLHPLDPRDALKAVLETKPPGKKRMKKYGEDEAGKN